MKKYLLWIVLGLLGGCVSSHEDTRSESQEETGSTGFLPGQPQPKVWFRGTVEQAFEQAKRDKSLIFLYWGAIWCPPCNELKANIFSKPKFGELMRGFIPVYLDGDTEEAQVWGERLQTSGYPTILVLDADKREIFRMSSSLNIVEFEEALQPILGVSKNFSLARARLNSGGLDRSEWKVLAFADWEQLPKEFGEVSEQLMALERATRLCPQDLKRERALLGAHFLTLAARLYEEKKIPKKLDSLRISAKEQLDFILNDPNATLVARTFVNNQAAAVSRWLYPDLNSAGYQDLKERWIQAAGRISENLGLSVDTRLGAVRPRLDFHHREHGETSISAELKVRVQQAVSLAHQQAQDEFERHSVTSGAADLLRQVGDDQGARALLMAELTRTNTPWYYQGSLANLEQELGNLQSAREWAAKARLSAQGRATKIQWITNDILMNAKDETGERRAYMKLLAREYYKVATDLSDGFAGRNRARSKRVEDAFQGLKSDPDFRQIIAHYARKCRELKDDNRNGCEQHFKQLL